MKHLLIATIAGLALVMVTGGILVALASSPLYQTTAMKNIIPLTSSCDKGPINPPDLATGNLEEDAKDWGVFCDLGTPTWVLTDVTTPALDGKSLRCSITGGQPNSHVHCYRNLLSEPAASVFVLTMPFYFTPATTCNNQGESSIIQALEFTMSKWHQGQRYEFAVQWENVAETPGDGAPQWRYWNSSQWVPFNPKITQCLAAGQWYTLTLEGEIVNSQVHYHRFAITNTNHILDLTVPPIPDSAHDDGLAIAVQLDGNFQEDAYDVFVDRVSFVRKPALSVTKQANPSPVQDGAQLKYTIHVTNNTNVTLTATVTDILPSYVAPSEVLVWTPTITAPGGVWTQQTIVTVETGFTGSLTNKVQATTGGGVIDTASVTVCANYCLTYLPIILKNS